MPFLLLPILYLAYSCLRLLILYEIIYYLRRRLDYKIRGLEKIEKI